MAPGLADKVEEILDEVRDRLREHREHRTRGERGRRGQIDLALGRKVGHCSMLLKEEPPPPGEKRKELLLREVVGLLLELGVDPRQTFSGFFGFDLEIYLLKLERQNTQLRWLKKQLRRAQPLDASLEELAEIAEEMEHLRLSDPSAGKVKGFAVMATLGQIEESEARARVECEAWGALAGLHRMTATFSSGASCLLRGLEVAKRWGLVDCEAKLLRRCCYLLGDQGDYEEAIECAERAFTAYASGGHQAGSGRALLDRGIMLRRTGQTRMAITFYEMSLSLLPCDAEIELFGVLQCMGVAYVELSELDRAKDCLDRMKGHLPEVVPDRMMASVLYLEGEIAIKELDYAAAEKALLKHQAVLLRADNVAELAPMSVRLAQVFLLSGKHADLRELVGRMFSLPARIRYNKLVQASLNEFLRTAMRGKLTLEFAEQIYGELMGGLGKSTAPPVVRRA